MWIWMWLRIWLGGDSTMLSMYIRIVLLLSLRYQPTRKKK